MDDETKPLAPGEAAAFMERIIAEAVRPYADKIAPISRAGDIAVVVHKVRDEIREAAEAWGWDGSSPAFRLSNKKRKSIVEHFEQAGDKVSERWFKAQRKGRVFLFVHGGTFLLNITKDGLAVEPGSLDPEDGMRS